MKTAISSQVCHLIAQQNQRGKNLQYLISLADEFTDIHAEVRSLVVVAHRSLLHSWRQWTVFVCYTVKESAITPSETERYN